MSSATTTAPEVRHPRPARAVHPRLPSQRTFSAKKGEIERKWWVADVDSKVLGRAATRIAEVLRGKHRPTFTPHVDTGDFVVVVNAARVRVTGRKLDQKLYRHYSGYPGGLRERKLKEMLAKHPERVIESAVKGMLPKNRLASRWIRKLKVYAGAEHPHAAQDPKPLDV